MRIGHPTTPPERHSLLGWGILLSCLAIIGLAVWFLSDLKVDW